MKVINTLWGILLTIMMYAILTTLGYQVITNEDLQFSMFFGSICTLLGRFALAKALNNVEADFSFIRELLTIVALILLTLKIYN
jgi:hypothetical protein